MCSFAFLPFFLNSTTVLHWRPASKTSWTVQRPWHYGTETFLGQFIYPKFVLKHISHFTNSSHCIFHITTNIQLNLYFSLVQSKFMYCSQLWRPRLIKDITCLERVQRRATKFVLNDFTSNYKSRLTSLNLFPLTYWLEIQNLMFLIKCIKYMYPLTILTYSLIYLSSPHAREPQVPRSLSIIFINHALLFLQDCLSLECPSTNWHLPILCFYQKADNNLLWDHFTANFNPACPCTHHFLCPCSSCSYILSILTNHQAHSSAI